MQEMIATRYEAELVKLRLPVEVMTEVWGDLDRHGGKARLQAARGVTPSEHTDSERCRYTEARGSATPLAVRTSEGKQTNYWGCGAGFG